MGKSTINGHFQYLRSYVKLPDGKCEAFSALTQVQFTGNSSRIPPCHLHVTLGGSLGKPAFIEDLNGENALAPPLKNRTPKHVRIMGNAPNVFLARDTNVSKNPEPEPKS
jgi:hypothetical protein